VRVRDFPTGREWIAAITAGGPGFVAVGASQVVHLGPGTPCYGDYDGRIWTSPDGRHWSRQSVGLDKTPLTHVVEFNGVVYAFGRPGDTCERRGDRGYSVWSSADGMAWTLAAVEVGAPYGAIFDVVATDSRLVALGWDTNRHSQAWLSDDGSTWSVPQVPPLSVAWGASLGDTVVAFDNPDDPVTGLQVDVSYDAGANWQQVFVDLSLEATYDFDAHVAVSNGTLLVATRACCVRGADVGIPITTSDGRTWAVGPTLASPADALVPLVNGFMTMSRDDGGTLLSPDGRSWFVGPTLPSTRGGGPALLAAGPLGIVDVPGGAGDGGGHVHFAPADRLDPAAWTTPAEVAEGR